MLSEKEIPAYAVLLVVAAVSPLYVLSGRSTNLTFAGRLNTPLESGALVCAYDGFAKNPSFAVERSTMSRAGKELRPSRRDGRLTTKRCSSRKSRECCLVSCYALLTLVFFRANGDFTPVDNVELTEVNAVSTEELDAMVNAGDSLF